MPGIYETDTKDVLIRIARGLYWHHYKKPLNTDRYKVLFLYGVDLFQTPKITLKKQQKDIKAILELQDLCERVDLLPGVLTYWIGKAYDQENAMVFLMLYRKSVLTATFATHDNKIPIEL